MPLTRRTARPSLLALAVIAGITLPVGAFAQSAQPQDPMQTAGQAASRAAELDAVTVTGSRIARANTEGPAPVVVITSEEIEKQGFTTVWESLGTLSQFTGNAQNESDVTGQSPNGQFINLRGLGPGYQLVLLNGQRIAEYPQAYGSTSTAVSTGSIPAAAVERIEVMSGGASAIYGSDAVAGVINIITRTDYDGDTFRLRAGTTTQGGGDTGMVQWVGGRSGNRWNVLYAFEHLEREEIVASQRGLSYWAAPQYRTDNPRPTAALSGVYLRTTSPNVYYWPDANGNLSTSYDALVHACRQTNPTFRPFHSATSVAVPNRCGNYGYFDARTLQNAYSKTSGYVSANFDINDNLEAYTQLLVNRSNDKSSSQTHYFIGEAPFLVQDPVLGRVAASRSFNPGEVGQNYITFDERAWNLNVGLRGSVFNNRFDWDASLVTSRFEIKTARPRFLTNAVRDYYMGPVQGYHADGTEIRELYVDRLFAPGTPALYDQLTTMVQNDGSSKNDSAQFVFTGPLFDLPAGPLQMAALLEASRMDYDLRPDPRITVDYTGTDRVYNLTGTPGGGPRDRHAAGLEFRVPVLSSLEATLAARYDRYKDVASNSKVTWQAGLEWRPFDSLLLRGSHATSFRAPDILWIYAGTTGSNPFIIDEYWCRRDGLVADSDACIATGSEYYYQSYRVSSANPLLQPETGKSTTLGFVWDVMPNMSATVDYYRIELQDRVQLVTDAVTLEREADCRLGRDRAGNTVDVNSSACQFYLQSVQRPVTASNPLGAITRFSSYPINASVMKTTGVDASLRYSHDMGGWGELGLQVGYTHVFSFETAQFADSELVDSRNDINYNPVRNRSNLRLNWAIGDWNTSLYGYRTGSIPNFNQINNPGRGSSHTLWNADVSKQVTEQMRLGLSVVNIADKMPPHDPSYTAWPYFSPRVYSPIGRQVYANFTWDF